MPAAKVQRVRDPIHDLIEFQMESDLEQKLWEVVNSRTFQRLRRVKQLGFSDLVYPGATHSRFAHSLGVFNTARMLSEVVFQGSRTKPVGNERAALAAALLHDIGHGPFSHAFERVGKELKLEFSDHEAMTARLVREGEIAELLLPLGSGFSNDVAMMILKEGRISGYNAIISSQFDADRLDYIRRDPFMTGSGHGAIDFRWLLSNLRLGEVSVGIDDQGGQSVETLVIGHKAALAAEAYVIGLFHLYPAIYYHKATRAAEKIFEHLLVRVFRLVSGGNSCAVGLSQKHPIMRFARNPDAIEIYVELDDTVLWGALHEIVGGSDKICSDLALRLLNRKLWKCIDIRELILNEVNPKRSQSEDLDRLIEGCCNRVDVQLAEILVEKRGSECFALDRAIRKPYKQTIGTGGPIEQINVLTSGGELIDLRAISPAVAAIKDFRVLRLYVPDRSAVDVLVKNVVREEVERCKRES